MKKTLALVLAILLALSLFGCAGSATTTTTSAPAGSAAAAATQAGSAAPASAAASVAPGSKGTLVYLCNSLALAFCQAVSARFQTLSDQNGYKYIAADSNRDSEKMIQLVETYCNQKISGLFINTTKDLGNRVKEICDKAGVPWLTESTRQPDSKTGKMLTAGCELAANQDGGLCAQWALDNAKKLNVDLSDQSKVGVITVVYSSVDSFVDRCNGALDVYKKALPKANYFSADTLKEGASGVTAEAANTETSAILAAHPEIKYWLIFGCLDDLAQGAARAVEAANLNKVTIETSIGGEVLTQEWAKSNYDGCWKACNYFTGADFTNVLFPAMMQLISGKVKMENLFASQKESGETYATFKIVGTNMDKSQYLAYASSSNNGTLKATEAPLT